MLTFLARDNTRGDINYYQEILRVPFTFGPRFSTFLSNPPYFSIPARQIFGLIFRCTIPKFVGERWDRIIEIVFFSELNGYFNLVFPDHLPFFLLLFHLSVQFSRSGSRILEAVERTNTEQRDKESKSGGNSAKSIHRLSYSLTHIRASPCLKPFYQYLLKLRGLTRKASIEPNSLPL